MNTKEFVKGMIAIVLGAAVVTVIMAQPGHADVDRGALNRRAVSESLSVPRPTDEPAMAPRPIPRIVPVEQSSGVRYATVKVNGFNVKGVVDTGASYLFLNGATFCKMALADMIEMEDVITTSSVQDATGRVTKHIIYKVRVRMAGAVLKSVIAASPMFEDKVAGCADTKTLNLIGNSVWDRFDAVTISKYGVVLSNNYNGGKE